MPTTEVVLQLGEFDDEIKKLSQELGVGDRTSTQNVASPMSAPEDGRLAGGEDEGEASADSEALKNLFVTALNSEDMHGLLENEGYKNLQELKNDLQDTIGPLGYLLFKSEVEKGGQNVPDTSDSFYQPNSDFYVNEYKFGTREEYCGDIITMIAMNPEKRTEILAANGYKDMASLKGEMQNEGPTAYLELKSKLEGMGYSVPKVGVSGAYKETMVDPASKDYESMDGEDYFGEQGTLDRQIEDYQKLVDALSDKNSMPGNKGDYFENDAIIKEHLAYIAELEKEKLKLENGYIDANYELIPSDLLEGVNMTVEGDSIANEMVLASKNIDARMFDIFKYRNDENQFFLDLESTSLNTISLNDDEALELYLNAQLGMDKEGKIADMVLDTVIPGGGYIHNVSNVIDKIRNDETITWDTIFGLEDPVDTTFIGMLEGEYTTCEFNLIIDKQRGNDEDDNMEIMGIVVYGKPIILDDGTVVANPNNMIVFSSDLEPVDPDNPNQHPVIEDIGGLYGQNE